MEPAQNYIEINRQSWNEKTGVHLKSDFYDVEGFLNGNTSLNDIELALLGEVKGKSILHLQCHFGQDSISLGRMGAHVTGVDLSDEAIKNAALLAHKTKVDADFICCDLYDLPNHLTGQFDIVYTSYGVIGWLPDLDQWAKIIATFLKPGGRLIFVEFHPVVWMFDTNFEKIAYNYFNAGAIIETENGTYANRDAAITPLTVTWNHPLSEVVNSLIKNGLEIHSLDEYDYSPYNCFNKTIEYAPKKFRIAHLGNNLPITYSIEARKKN